MPFEVTPLFPFLKRFTTADSSTGPSAVNTPGACTNSAHSRAGLSSVMRLEHYQWKPYGLIFSFLSGLAR